MSEQQVKAKMVDEMLTDLGVEVPVDKCPYWAIELVDVLIRKGWRKAI